MATTTTIPSHCSCGALITWAKDERGTSIPLDLRPPVYRNTGDMAGPNTRRVERMRGAAVTHFATCPNANQFAKSVWKTAIETIEGLLTEDVIASSDQWKDVHIALHPDRDGANLAAFVRQLRGVIKTLPKPKPKYVRKERNR